MEVPFGYWPVFWGFLWLCPALLVNGQEDTFQEEDTERNDLPGASTSTDDILAINQALIPLEAPESSFLIEGDIIKALAPGRSSLRSQTAAVGAADDTSVAVVTESPPNRCRYLVLSPFRIFSSANPRWPKKGGIVQIPYIISYKYDKVSVKIIQEAFEDFAKFTCIRFIPYSYQKDFISIAPLSGCFSNVGRVGGMQVVSLAPSCLRKGKGVALHEFMHVLGFWHEHCRADRDKYIGISWNEILTGFEINFMKSWNTNMLVDYDYSSVMHYGRNAFSMTGLPTITPLSHFHASLGQRWNLSTSDIARVNKLYKCSQVAMQPETSTERILQEKMKDFVPPEACSTASQARPSTIKSLGSITETTEMTRPATESLQKSDAQTNVGITQLLSRPTERGSSPTGTQTKKIPLQAALTREEHNQTLVPPGVASKMEKGREHSTVALKVAPETRAIETEVQTLVKGAQKSTLQQALENATSSAKEEMKTQASDFEEAYTLSQPKTTEALTRTAPRVKHATPFRTSSSASLLNDIGQGTTMKPSKKAPFWPLHSPTATPAEYVTEIAAPKETKVTGSGVSEDVNVPLYSTEGYLFTMTEKQPEELVQPSTSSYGNEAGNFTHVLLMEGVQANATSSVYATTFPRVPGTPAAASHAVEATLSSEAGHRASFTTGVPNGMAEKEAGSSHRTKGIYAWYPSTTRSSPANESEQMSSTEEVLALGSSEAQDYHLGGISVKAGAAASSTSVTNHRAASRMKEAIHSEGGPMVHSVEVQRSPLPPGSPTKKGGWEEIVTPSASLSGTEWVQATERPMESERWTPLYAKLAGQTLTQKSTDMHFFTEPASLAMETNPSMVPSEGTPLKEASWSPNPELAEQRESLILQPSKTEKYGLSALVGRWTTSTGVQAEEPQVKQTIGTAFATDKQSMSVKQKVTMSRGEEMGSKIPVGTEESEAHGSESPWRSLTSESVSSQMPSYAWTGWAEIPQPHSDFSLVTGITGTQNGDTQVRLRKTTSPRQEISISSSETKSSYMEHTTKGWPVLDRQFKPESTSQASPGTEVKEHGSILEGILLPTHKTRTVHNWVSGSRTPPQSTESSHSGDLHKETTSFAVSAQGHTVSYKRKSPEITVMSEGASEDASISSFNFSTTLALGNQTLKYTKEPPNSPPLWETESTGVSESSSPQFPSKFSSRPGEMSSFAEEKLTHLANATEEMLLRVKWAQKDLAQRASVLPSLREMQPTVMFPTAPGGTALPFTTGLLKSPKFVTYGGEPAVISPIKETLPSTVGITTSNMLYSTSVIPLETWEIQARIPIESRTLTSRDTKKSGEVGLETYTRMPVSAAELNRMPSARTSTLGLRRGHTINTTETKGIETPQLSFEPETIWPTYKNVKRTQTEPLLEKGETFGKSGVYVLGETTTTVDVGLGSKRSAKNGGGIASTTTMAAELASQMGYTDSSPSLVEESTTVHGKKEALNISAGPTRKLVLELMGSPIPGNESTTEMVPSILDSQNHLASEKTKATFHLEISSEGMYLTDVESTEGVTATTGVSLVRPQTVHTDEVRIQLKYHRPHVTQGLGKGEQLIASTEASRQISKTHTAMRQEEMTQMKEVGSVSKNSSSVDNSTSGHQLAEDVFATENSKVNITGDNSKDELPV